MNTCQTCRVVHGTDEISAVGRFNSDGPTGYRYGAAIYPTREQAHAARCAAHQGATAYRDTATLDHIAGMLGTLETWDGAADLLDSIADLIAVAGRPHPGHFTDYKFIFAKVTGRQVPVDYSQEG